MKRAVFYAAAGFSAVLLARKFTPSLIRELRQMFM